MKRIRWIDIAKGLGIVLVVLGHCQIPNTVLRIITAFHMPLFFFLAGYTYSPEKYSLPDFCKSRMKTIVWPYLFFTALSVLASFGRKLVGQDTSLAIIFDSFISMGFVESNPPLWFLRSLFVVEILFCLYQRVHKKHWLALLGVYFIMILAFALNWRFYMRSVNGFVFYGLGYAMKELRVMDHVKRHKFPVCIVSAMIFAGTWMYASADFSITTNSNLIAFVVITHAGILGMIALSMCLESMKLQIFDYLGKNSLVILCTHILVKDVISVLLKLILKNSTFMDEVSMEFAVLTTVAICIGSCVTAEIINRFFPFVIGKHYKHARISS